jgi:hypothetical protein
MRTIPIDPIYRVVLRLPIVIRRVEKPRVAVFRRLRPNRIVGRCWVMRLQVLDNVLDLCTMRLALLSR